MPTAVLSAYALCCPILPVRLRLWDLVQVRQVRLVHRVAQPLRVPLVRLASQPTPPNPWGLQPVAKPVASRPQRLQPKLLRQPQPQPWPARLPPPCAPLKC